MENKYTRPRSIKYARPIIALVFGLIVCCSPCSFAATRNWNGTSSNWFTPGNWLPSGVPVASNSVTINNTGFSPVISSSGALTGVMLVGTGGNTGTLTLATGGSLTSTANQDITVGAGGIGTVNINGGTWDASSSMMNISDTGVGSLNITAGSLLTNSANVGFDRLANVTISGGSWTSSTLQVPYGTLTMTGGTISSGTTRVAVQGSGQATLSGGTWNTSGDFQIGINANLGTLYVSGTAALNVNGGAGTINVGDASSSLTQIIVGNNAAFTGNIAAATVTSADPSSSLHFTQTNSFTLASQITGTLRFSQEGSGTTILTGANTYTGTTFVSDGTLEVDGTTSGQGNYAVVAATPSAIATPSGKATLAGTGSIGLAANGTVTVGSSFSTTSRVSPGGDSTIGTLTVRTSGTGGVIFSDHSVLAIDVGGTALSDRLDITGGSIDLTSALDTLSLNALPGAFDGTIYTLATFTQDVSGGTFNSVIGLPANYVLLYTPTSILLEPVVVPEAGTWFAAALMVCSLFGFLRRRVVLDKI